VYGAFDELWTIKDSNDRFQLATVDGNGSQKRREGRIAPALSALEKNSRQLNAQLAAKTGQTTDRESEERQRRAAVWN
jgi:hypothetical protein